MIIIPEDVLRIAEALNAPIDELGLSVRSYNGLRRWGITTVAGVYRAYQDKQLPRIRNLGEKSVIEIEKLLEEHLAKVAPVNNSETPNSSDCISRQAAIETVMECYDNDELFEVYEDKLRELPPAQPGRIKAKWLPIGIADAVGGESAMWGNEIAYHACDNCWQQALEKDGEEVLSDFCPNCGAEMREVTEHG